MFDIMTDSVYDIAQAQYNEAYGGRDVVDFFETPCNLTMIKTASVRPDAHIEIKSVVHNDLESVSAIPGFGDVFQEGENKSSHTRNPFKWKHEELSLTGVFGSAVKNYGKVMSILYAKNLPTDTFDDYFRNEWGIHAGADLSPMIPTLVGTDQMAFAAIVENRTPDVFIHPNYTGDSAFVWHDINRSRLSARAGRPIGCDFSKCRAYGEFQTRMLRNESSVPLEGITRLEYHLNLDEMPPPASLDEFPTVAFSQPPNGVIMSLIEKAVVMIEAHAVDKATEVVVKMFESTVIQVPDDYGPLDLVKDAVIPTARIDASNYRINEFLKLPADQGVFGAELQYNHSAIKEYRRDKDKRVVVGTGEAHWMLDIILPLNMANDMKGLNAIEATSIHAYRYLTGMLKCNFMGNLKLIGHITHGSRVLGDAFAKRVLADWGFNSVDFHHRKGDDILTSALSRTVVRMNILATLKNVCMIRSHRLLNRSMIVNGFFAEWKKVGTFEIALDSFFKMHRSRWVKRFKDRAYLSVDKPEKIRFQLKATFFAQAQIFWSTEEAPQVGIPMDTAISIISQTYRNFVRKRMNKEDNLALQTAEAVEGYVYDDPFQHFTEIQDAVAFFDGQLHLAVTMASVLVEVRRACDALALDVQGIFDEIQADVSEKRLKSAAKFNQSFQDMEDELKDVDWTPAHYHVYAPAPIVLSAAEADDAFAAWAESATVSEDRSGVQNIPLSEAILRLEQAGLVRTADFVDWVHGNYPAYVSEFDMAEMINVYHVRRDAAMIAEH